MNKNVQQKRIANGSPSIYYVATNRWCGKIQTGYEVETGKPKLKAFYGKTRDEIELKIENFRKQ